MNEERDGYIKGLRQLADLLENNEGLVLPYNKAHSPIYIFTNSKKELQDWARAFLGTLEKKFDDESIKLSGKIDGLHIGIFGNREGVCERVVVGTREVIVPAREAREAEPEHTETVEDVEWICGSLLADEVSA